MSTAWAGRLRILQGLLILLCFALVAPAVAWVGNGYAVSSVDDLPDGSGIQAVLTPVSSGDSYGPDIAFLAVTARYCTRSINQSISKSVDIGRGATVLQLGSGAPVFLILLELGCISVMHDGMSLIDSVRTKRVTAE